MRFNALPGVLAETELNRLGKTYGCGVEVSLAVLGGKWKPVILARLKQAPMTYGELRRALPSLSDKVLTERLKQLEEQGLAVRDTAAEGVRRRYKLTELGESLRPVLDALYAWGESAAADLGLTIVS